MTPAALAEYLHRHIPLSRAMDVSVLEADVAKVVLQAPLPPNHNMHGTMFGGSLATLALMAAWSVLHLRLDAAGVPSQLVIHHTEVDYIRPVSGTAQACARLDGTDWSGFARMLERRGKARATVSAEVVFEGDVAARLTGKFVARVEK